MSAGVPGPGGNDWGYLIAMVINVFGAYGVHALAGAKKSIYERILYLLLIALFSWWGTSYLTKVFSNPEKHIASEHGFEISLVGCWLEEYVDPKEGRQYGVINMIFNKDTKKMHMYGNAFKPDGTWVARWMTTSVEPNAHDFKLTCTYEGNAQGTSITWGTEEITFQSTNDTILTATGRFGDLFTGGEPRNFKLVRLSPEQCDQYCSKELPVEIADQSMLVRRYHEGRTDMPPALSPASDGSNKATD